MIDVNKIYNTMDEENDDAMVRGVANAPSPVPPNPPIDDKTDSTDDTTSAPQSD